MNPAILALARAKRKVAAQLNSKAMHADGCCCPCCHKDKKERKGCHFGNLIDLIWEKRPFAASFLV